MANFVKVRIKNGTERIINVDQILNIQKKRDIYIVSFAIVYENFEIEEEEAKKIFDKIGLSL